MLLLLFLLSALAIHGKKLTPEEKKAFSEASNHIFFLNSFNYDQVIAEGTFAVFYGLRRCTHCARFTPVWRELELVNSSYAPIRLAKVECMAPDNSVIPLCEWVNGFPSIFLHQNGVTKEEMLGDLNYNLTLNWLKSMVIKYTPLNNSSVKTEDASDTTAMDMLKEIAGKGREPSSDINPDGEIVHLTEQDFDEKTKGKVWFVMFHAPWCSHCKHLAPTWEKLAKQVKGYINIGKVDATKETKLADRFGIDRFPMLKLLPDMEPVSYNEERSLEGLQKAVMKFVSAPFFTPIASLEIPNLMKEKEDTFFLIYNPNSMDESILNNFEMAVRPWVGTVNVYVTPDDAYSQLGSHETKGPLLVVSKEYGKLVEPYTDDFGSLSLLSAWVKARKDPLLLELDSSNQNQIFNGESLVVMALVDPDFNRTSWIHAMQSVVKLWTSEERSVLFVWLDAITHSGYVERVYSVKTTQLPYLVIADPSTNEYYNLDSNREPFVFDADKIMNYIEDIIDGKLTGQSSSGILGKFARKLINSATYISKLSSRHPWIPLILILLLVYVIYTFVRVAAFVYEEVPEVKKD